MKKAFITGITGQDGSYLAKLLLEKEYDVCGGVRRSSVDTLTRLKYLKIVNKIKLLPFEILDYGDIFDIIKKYQFDEVYNLASQSFVKVSFDQPIYTTEVTGLGTLRILEAIRAVSPHTKFYQASSSEMFGAAVETPQKETTIFNPQSPYGIAKTFAHHASELYRRAYDIFACCGILFNHESPLRGNEFVTKKIVNAVKAINEGKQDHLEVGNLNAKRDWGFSPEYCEAMYLMMQHKKPDSFVIATGETHTIREFIELAFKFVDINIVWEGSGINEIGIDKNTNRTLIKINPIFFRPAEVNILRGDASKAKRELNWQPKVKIEKLVEIMMTEDF